MLRKFLFCFLCSFVSQLSAQEFRLGISLKNQGVALSNLGTLYSLVLRLCSAETGENCSYTQVFQNLRVDSNGIIDVTIGPSLPDLNEYRYVDLQIQQDFTSFSVPLNTRATITAVPLSLQSLNSNKLSGMTTEELLTAYLSASAQNQSQLLSSTLSSNRDAVITSNLHFESSGRIIFSQPNQSIVSWLSIEDELGSNIISLESNGTIKALSMFANKYYGDGSNLAGVIKSNESIRITENTTFSAASLVHFEGNVSFQSLVTADRIDVGMMNVNPGSLMVGDRILDTAVLSDTDATLNNLSIRGHLIRTGSIVNGSESVTSTHVILAEQSISGDGVASQIAIVGGSNHRVTSSASAILAGVKHQISANAASVVAGLANTITGSYSVILGGKYNHVMSSQSGIVAGYENSNSGKFSFIGGGRENQILGDLAFIAASARSSTVSSSVILGGTNNTINEPFSAIINGREHTVVSSASAILAGIGNRVTGAWSSTVGGLYNTVSGTGSVISGGESNQNFGVFSNISAGRNNTVTGNENSIIAGSQNYVLGSSSSILSGHKNTIRGNASSILGGNNLELIGDNSLGFSASSTNYTVTETSVVVFMAVSMGINLTSPLSTLDVAGSLKIANDDSESAGVIRFLNSRFEGFDGTLWKPLDLQSFSGGGTSLSSDLQKVYIESSDFGIGTTIPIYPLTVINRPRNDGLSPVALVIKNTSDTSDIFKVSEDLDGSGNISLRDTNNSLTHYLGTSSSYITTGYFGVGHDNPTAALHLKASDNLNDLVKLDSSSGGSRVLSISELENGSLRSQFFTVDNQLILQISDPATYVLTNFGLGQNNPSSLLDVLGQGSQNLVRVSTDISQAPVITVSSTGFIGIATFNPESLLHVHNGSSQFLMKVTSNTPQTLLSYNSQGRLGLRTDNMMALVDINPEASVSSFRISSSTTTADSLVVASSGRVGIGTSIPQAITHIVGKGSEAVLMIEHTDLGSNSVTVAANGKVGIGTSQPDAILQVSNGGLCVGSDALCDSGDNNEGQIYAQSTVIQGADYAEYFLSAELMSPGDVVGLDILSGKVRKYRLGDELIGVVTTKPGIIGNAEEKSRNSVLVALLGQVPVNTIQLIERNRRIFTRDMKSLGLRLANGKVLLRLHNPSESIQNRREINLLKKKQLELLKKLSTINTILNLKNSAKSEESSTSIGN